MATCSHLNDMANRVRVGKPYLGEILRAAEARPFDKY